MRLLQPEGPATGQESARKRAGMPCELRHVTHRASVLAAAGVVQTFPSAQAYWRVRGEEVEGLRLIRKRP